MKQYKILIEDDAGELEIRLNNLAAAGWELKGFAFHANPDNNCYPYYRAVLEKEKE